MLFDDPQNQNRSGVPEGTNRYRQLYINTHNDKSINRPKKSHTENELLASGESFVSRSLSPFELGLSSTTTTSLASPSITSIFPMKNISHAVSPLSSSHSLVDAHSSILVRAYSRQIQAI
jgi:hypothetical protein